MIAQPWLEPHELEHSCALDVADDVELTQEEAALLGGIHRSDLARVEVEFLDKLRAVLS